MADLSWTKVFSGKFIFTVVTALVFAYAACRHILNSDQINSVIMLVVAFYFSKSTGEQNGKTETNTTSQVTTQTKT